MAVSKTVTGGVEATIWLRYLKSGDSVRFVDTDDTGIALTYRLTGDHDRVPRHTSCCRSSGRTARPRFPPGAVTLALQLLSEPPDLYVDTFGRDLYGHETLSVTDLINTSKDLFETLADRILEVRGVNSVPRVEAVTIDARTGHGTQNMELMSTAAPEKPSRYRMRLQVDERPIYDRMCFVSSVRHFITRSRVDVADPSGHRRVGGAAVRRTR